MSTNLASTISRTGGVGSWLIRGLFAVASVSVVALCGLLAIKGPEIGAAGDAQEARAIDEENRAFCSELGAGPETSGYIDCAAGLMGIRERYLTRYLGDSIL
jgi:hypothetical protein